MTITKLGHCCLLIEDPGVKLLTDPGSYSTPEDSVTGLDAILITHEHQDHFHVESLKKLLVKNPAAEIYTILSVGQLLEAESIPYKVVKQGDTFTIKGVEIEVFGEKHAVMHSSIPQSDNVGFFVANRLFYPGDSFMNPGKPVEVLALPVAGPWCKLSESIEYAIEIHPKRCFPVHDGILKNTGSVHRLPPQVLQPLSIEFIVPEIGKGFEV